MGRLITRTAVDDTLTDLIKRADYDVLEDALNDVLSDQYIDVQICDDPWDIARNVVDSDYIRAIYVKNAEDVAERVRGLLTRWQVVEFDAYNGDLLATYTDMHDVVQNKNEAWVTQLAEKHDDTDSFCLAYDKMVDDDRWLITRSCFNAVTQLLNQVAKNNAMADGDWDEYARDWLEENEIDPNADCVFCINSDYKFISCSRAEVDRVVLNALCRTQEQQDALKAKLASVLFGVNE